MIQSFPEKIQDVILFGSQINENSNNFSDYDVLIVLKSDYDWQFRKKIIHLIYELEVELDILFDVHLISENEIDNTLKGAEPIYVNGIKDWVYACYKSL